MIVMGDVNINLLDENVVVLIVFENSVVIDHKFHIRAQGFKILNKLSSTYENQAQFQRS